MNASSWILAADIGQSIDPTALAVLEVQTRQNARQRFYSYTDENRPADLVEPASGWYWRNGTMKDPHTIARIDVHHLERLPLRMPYPEQIEHVARMMRRPPLVHPRAELVLDATGVGRPIVDMFSRAGLAPRAVTITAGDQESVVSAGRFEEYRVAKLLLVSRLQSMLNERTLRIPKNHPEARVLALELQDFRANISESGVTRFGAREGQHDDLVLALAIGVWYAWYAQTRTSGVFAHSI